MVVTWESTLEVQPSLGQCRVLLQQRLGAGHDEEHATLDHSSWSVSACLENALLRLVLNPAQGSSGESAVVEISVCEDAQIPPDCLRNYTDHLCVVLHVSPGSPWLQKLLKVHRGAAEDELYDVRCRSCSRLLLEAAQKSAFVLPVQSWDACSELVTCECCAKADIAPKRMEMPQIQARQGCVYISLATLLVSAADLRPSAAFPSEDDLLRCRCGYVLGEVPQNDSDKQSGARQRQRKGPRSIGISLSWSIGRGCSNQGFSLYKHRISMLKPTEGTGTCNLLAAFTEEAAVGMQLLTLRSQERHSRFILLPRRPEGTFGGPNAQSNDGDAPIPDGVAAVGDCLELRMLAPRVLIIGPSEQSLNAPIAGIADVPVLRATKVCFRRRPCTTHSQSGCLVVVPHIEFEAVFRALRQWSVVLPASLRCCPLGRDDGGGVWQTSYLPLPPQEFELE